MRWNDLYLNALGAYLPEKSISTQEAVDNGDYTAEDLELNGYRAVRVAGPEETGPVMAGAAGKIAVQRSGLDADDFGLVVHGSIGHQGQDIWTPAHFVQAEAVGGAASAIELRQGSNSGMAAFEVAAAWVKAHGGAALATVGDAFTLPYFDRWRADDQLVYGDGAAAAVLSTTPGFAKVLSTASRADASLEPLYRGTDGWTPAPFHDGQPIDLGGRKRAWLERHEGAYDEAIESINKNFGVVLQDALADADTDLAGTQWFVHANMSRSIADWGFYGALGLSPKQTPYEWGLDLGHVGGADQLLGLNHLIETGRPKPGDKVVIASAGIGFMWTVAVVQIEALPAW